MKRFQNSSNLVQCMGMKAIIKETGETIFIGVSSRNPPRIGESIHIYEQGLKSGYEDGDCEYIQFQNQPVAVKYKIVDIIHIVDNHGSGYYDRESYMVLKKVSE